MKKIYLQLILSFVILSLCACTLQSPRHQSELLISLPDLLSTTEGMSIDKAEKLLQEAYESGYIIDYVSASESGENYREFTDDRGILKLNGFECLGVCIPCKEGSYNLDELKELLKRYGIRQALNERTTICEYSPEFNSHNNSQILPTQLSDEFSIYCTDRVAHGILQYFSDNKLSVEEESAFYAQGSAYKYSIQKIQSYLFVLLNTRFEGPPRSYRFTFPGKDVHFSNEVATGWKGSPDEKLVIFDM